MGAAIHDRHFGGGEFDHAVVDPETGQRRHQVLDRGDARAVLFEHRAEARIANVGGARRNIHAG